MALAALAVPIATSLGVSATLPSLAKEFKKAIEPQEVQRTLETSQYKDVARAGYAGLENAQTSPLDRFVSALPFAPVLDERTRLTFFRAAEQKAKALGYSDSEANRLANLAVRADLYPGTFGEAGALAYGSVASEKVGELLAGKFISQIPAAKLTVEATKSLNPLKNPLAMAAVKGVAPAGFLEGGVDVIASELSTRAFERRKPEEILLNVGLGGAAGAATAGLFAIPTTGQILSRPRVAKGSLILGYAVDPFEYPGDVGAGVLTKRLGEEVLRIPVKTPVANVGVAANVLADVFGPTVNTATNIQTQATSDVASLVNNTANQVNAVAANVPATVPADVTSPDQTISDVPSDTTTPTDTNVPSDSTTPTDTTTQENTNVPANVATDTLTTGVQVAAPTPIFRGIVPLPPLFPIGPEPGGGISRTGELLYFDELGRAKRLLRRLL